MKILHQAQLNFMESYALSCITQCYDIYMKGMNLCCVCINRRHHDHRQAKTGEHTQKFYMKDGFVRFYVVYWNGNHGFGGRVDFFYCSEKMIFFVKTTKN